MKKRIRFCFLFVVVLYLVPATNLAQSKDFLGTKTPYIPSGKTRNTAPPSGFKSVFINYTGRHGARFLTKAGSDIEVLAVLQYADKNNSLTQKGKQILKMTERFLSIESGNYENITLLGGEEQAAIGKRIWQNYPRSFSGNGIDIVMTYKVRTHQSAKAFMKSFESYKGDKNFQVIPDSIDNTLRFYDLSPAYQDFKKSETVQSRIDSLGQDPRTKSTAANICSKIFTPSFAAGLQKKEVEVQQGKKLVKVDAVSFAENLYDLYCVQFSVSTEMKQKGYTKDSIDFGIAFNLKDLEWLDFKNGAEDFYEKGPGIDTLGIQVKIAVPLLSDYINSIDDIVNKKRTTDAIFRFTHAEAISPFATLLGIPAASVPARSVFDYQKHWKTSSIIPLSANIYWVLYTDGKDYLVKVMLNEQEVLLPIPSKKPPFYKWEDVKQYYLQKINSLKPDSLQTMHEYLLQVK